MSSPQPCLISPYVSAPESTKFNVPGVDPDDPYRTIKQLVVKISVETKRKVKDVQTDDEFSGSEKPSIGLTDFIFRMVRYLDRW